MTGDWDGLSLRYVRQLLGQPPRYGSANEAREASGQLRPGLPPVGAVCWYETNPYGNVAVCIGPIQQGGRPTVVCIRSGWPTLRHYDDGVLGEYQGWTETIGEPLTPADPDGG